jgi:hypothetical protein
VMDDATRRKIRGALCAILVSATEKRYTVILTGRQVRH